MKFIEEIYDIDVISDGEVENPILIKNYLLPPNRRKDGRVNRVQLMGQILHRNLKHFNVRKAIPVDNDDRRPIYIFQFDDYSKFVNFMEKHFNHFIAFQQIDIAEIDGGAVPSVSYVYGCSLYRLRSFTAWIEYLLAGNITSNCVRDCSILTINGRSTIIVPEPTFDGFIYSLSLGKALNRKGIDISPSEQAEIDGLKLDAKQIADYVIKKAIIERADACTMN